MQCLKDDVISPAKIALGTIGVQLGLAEVIAGGTALHIASTMKSDRTLKDTIMSHIKQYEQGSGVISALKERGITFVIDKVWKKYPITYAQLKTAGLASVILSVPTIALSLWAIKSGMQDFVQDSRGKRSTQR
jgi:hypothetical protein